MRYLMKPLWTLSQRQRYWKAWYRMGKTGRPDPDYRGRCFKCRNTFVMFDGIMMRGLEMRPRFLVCDTCWKEEQSA